MLADHIFYGIVAAAVIFTVNIFGFLMKDKGYSSMHSYMSTEQRVFNIVFRIVAPVVVWCFFIWILSYAGFVIQKQDSWFAVAYYWCIRIFLCFVLGQRDEPILFGTIPKAILSCLLAYYFTQFIIGVDIMKLIPSTESVVFQFWIMVAIVAIGLVSGEKGTFDYEKQFYEIQSMVEDILPRRFRQDIALQSLFYSFAMIEDYYRPKHFRWFERIAARFKLAKTTGIMQVKSNKALSDKDSIYASFPIIEGIWDEYLEKADNLYTQAQLKVTEDSYEYILNRMAHCIASDFPYLHARYMGTTQFKGTQFFWSAYNLIAGLSYIKNYDKIIAVCQKPSFSSEEILLTRIEQSKRNTSNY